MKRPDWRRRVTAALLTLLAAGILSSGARAAFVFQLSQAGPDVVVVGSGTLDLTDLTSSGSGVGGSGIVPSAAILAINPTGTPLQSYDGVSGATGWGAGGLTLATTSAGDSVVIAGGGLFLDSSYVSGSPLADSMVFQGATFADLGFTEGTYTYTWGSGATADSLVVTSEVPEPSTWAELGVGGVVLIGFAFRPRVRTQA